MQLWKVEPSLQSSRHNHMDSGEGLMTSGLNMIIWTQESKCSKLLLQQHIHISVPEARISM